MFKKISLKLLMCRLLTVACILFTSNLVHGVGQDNEIVQEGIGGTGRSETRIREPNIPEVPELPDQSIPDLPDIGIDGPGELDGLENEPAPPPDGTPAGD